MKRCPPLGGDWTLLGGIFDLPNLQQRISELEARSEDPNFWDDPASANEQFRHISRYRAIATPFLVLEKTERDIAELYEMLKAEPDAETENEADRMASTFIKDLDRYELQTLLSGE